MRDISRPIGWEFAERYPHLYRDGPLALSPRPCVICGQPTGSCTEKEHAIMAKATKQAPSVPDEVRLALQGGRPTAEQANAHFATEGPAMVVVKEAVYEDVEDPFATTKRRKLKYHKGQVITEEEAKANKVKAVQQQDVKGVRTK